MSVRRKLFLTMAAFIVAMSMAFIFLTQFVVKASIDYTALADRSREITQLSQRLVDYYLQNDRSWEGVAQIDITAEAGIPDRDVNLLLQSEQGQQILVGETDVERIRVLGIQAPIRIGDETIAHLYYLDPEVANVSILRLGISSSVTTLLLAGTALLTIIALFIAYRLSKRLTAPLSQLIPAIKRLGAGKLGTEVPVMTKDEYGTVARVFNQMSRQLKRAEDIRKNMAADVAHELRTPLTIIQGKLDLVQQSGQTIPPESLLPIQDELIRLTRLVNDLHQLSLAEAKKLPLERKSTCISSLLERTVDRLQTDVKQKGVSIRLHVETAHTTIEVDPHRITQVFLNLLVNAIRYTPADGSVTVTVCEERQDEGEARFLRIEVADTGIGIEPEQLPFLFQRFYRTDAARSRNRGGTGLGLAIAKEFVSAHNGTIAVESEPGKGTRFIVRLPSS